MKFFLNFLAILSLMVITLHSFASNVNSSDLEGHSSREKMTLEESEKLIEDLRQRIFELEEENLSYQNELYKVDLDYYKKYYKYLEKKADIHIEKFLWQSKASEALLWVVILVVFSGLLFSGIQLWRAASTRHISNDSSIELSAQKVKITSSVIGVIVLFISVAFLYLFLIEVYRVRVVDISSEEVKPSINVGRE